jgi:cellulose synthase (UDP-forming)
VQIGGVGPELNEDFSTSYMMTAFGFKGVFAIDTIANGDGPANFEDCMRQEYQ